MVICTVRHGRHDWSQEFTKRFVFRNFTIVFKTINFAFCFVLLRHWVYTYFFKWTKKFKFDLFFLRSIVALQECRMSVWVVEGSGLESATKEDQYCYNCCFSNNTNRSPIKQFLTNLNQRWNNSMLEITTNLNKTNRCYEKKGKVKNKIHFKKLI